MFMNRRVIAIHLNPVTSLWPAMLACLLLGCATAPAPRAGEGAPAWISSPEHAGYISVVGVAPRQAAGGPDAQQRVALTKARQALSEMVRVRVEQDYRQEQKTVNGNYTATVDAATRLSSHAALTLARSEITAQWTDPATGDLYLLLELPLAASVGQPSGVARK